MKIRDLIALPFFLFAILVLYIAVKIGSDWTAKQMKEQFLKAKDVQI